MGVSIGPKIVTEGLALCLDSVDLNSYKGGKSLITYGNWQFGSGSTTGFSQNGPTAANSRGTFEGPFGNTICWSATPTGNNSGDGGWYSSFSVDNSKMYRLSLWVKRTVYVDGRFYFGTNGYGTTNGVYTRTSGTLITNPYCYVSSDPPNTSEIPDSTWVLVVFHVHPSGSGIGSNHIDSGRYTISGGKYGSCVDFVWDNSTSSGRHRSYLYYTSSTEPRQYWCYPRVDIIDGSEPSIDDILNGVDILKDLSGNNNHGLIVNGYVYDSNSILFDGTKQYIDIGSVSTLNSIGDYMTCMAWVKTSINSGIQVIVGRGNDWRLQKSGTNYVFEHRNSSQSIVNVSYTNTSSDWIHIAATYSLNMTIKLFIDGLEVDSQPQTLSTRISSTQNQIGNNYAWHADGTYNDYWFSGNISNVKLYNITLTSTQILQNFNMTKGRFGK